MTEMDDRRWQRVATAVQARREALRLTQHEATALADVGTTVWGEIERCARTNYSPRTLTRVCRALRWTPESIQRVLRGEDPVEYQDDLSGGAVHYAAAPVTSRRIQAADQLDEAASVIAEGLEIIRRAARMMRDGD